MHPLAAALISAVLGIVIGFIVNRAPRADGERRAETHTSRDAG